MSHSGRTPSGQPPMSSFEACPTDICCIDLDADCTILRVDPRSSAAVKAGAKVGYRIVRVCGNVVTNRCELRSTLGSFDASDIVPIDTEGPLPPAPGSAQAQLNALPVQPAVGGGGRKVVSDVVIDDGNTAMVQSPPAEEKPGEHIESDKQGRRGSWTSDELDSDDDAADPAAGGATAGAAGPTPGLLGFAQVNIHSAPSGTMEAAPRRSMRSGLERALQKVGHGRCIIIVSSDNSVNPLGELEMLAKEAGTEVVSVDSGLRLKTRLNEEELASLFSTAMRSGKWFLVLRAAKSIQLLARLAALLEECWEHNAADVSPMAKIIISTEPHPHFPATLTKGAHAMGVDASFAASCSNMAHTISGSMSCMRAVTDGGGKSILQAATAGGVTSAAAGAYLAEGGTRKVRISAVVNVVDIEARDIFRRDGMAASAAAGKGRNEVNVAGSIVLRNTFAALPQDKFFTINTAGDPTRYAIGSSTGNVYIVDSTGSALLSLHAHDGSVWDVSFASKFSFVTASEDGTAARWELERRRVPAGPLGGLGGGDASGGAGGVGGSVLADDAMMGSSDTVRCGGDIYAVRHNKEGSVFAVGGLINFLVLRSNSNPPPTAAVPLKRVDLGTSVQCLAPLGTTDFVAGGGDGTTFVVDSTTGTIINKFACHQKKVPAICAQGSTVISGSFDATIRLWDARGQQLQHTMKFRSYVTGIDVDDHHLVACVGDSLYLWDVRNLSTVLGGFPHAWQGLNRGVKISAATKQVATASPDGVARFWQFK